MLEPISSTYDVIVVGARVAGAATAMLLARSGLRVLVLDRGAPTDDALSTHALMRGGVLQLHRWGLLPAVIAAGTPPVRTATFHYADASVPVPIKPHAGVDALYAPRRTVLDPLLVAAAQDAGAVVRHGVKVLDLLRDAGGRVAGVVVAAPGAAPATIRAGLVVGADGIRSLVARRVGAESYRTSAATSAVIYGYWRGLPADGYHWYFRPGASVGVIPTNDDLACVFVATPTRRFHDELRHDLDAGFRRVLAEEAPELAAQLAGPPVAPLRPFAGVPGFMRRSVGDGWALVGDAGYFKDPLTAHGITDALRDAELLAQAILAGSPSALTAYPRERDALSRELFEVTEAIAAFTWDATSIRKLHRRLGEAMVGEVERFATASASPRPETGTPRLRAPADRRSPASPS